MCKINESLSIKVQKDVKSINKLDLDFFSFAEVHNVQKMKSDDFNGARHSCSALLISRAVDSRHYVAVDATALVILFLYPLRVRLFFASSILQVTELDGHEPYERFQTLVSRCAILQTYTY